MQSIRRFLVDFTHLIADAWRIWGALAVVMLAAIFSMLLPGSVNDRVRYCGLTLQLLGIYTVVSGLRDKRRIFNRPSLLSYVRSGFMRVLRLGAQPHTFAMNASSGGVVSGTAKVSCWRGIPPEATVEVRLAVLEENLVTLRTELAETAVVLNEETRKSNESLDMERTARELADCDIRTQLEKFGAGSLYLETAGLFWLVLGTILATIPTETVNVLAWFINTALT